VPKKILFVCIENAGRSQMAEAFFRKYAPADFEPISAGTQPIDEINPTVVKVMKEVGIDLANQKPKLISNQMIQNSYKTVNMGCIDKESCPALFIKNIEEWQILDPKGKTIEEVRKIRDEIETNIRNLVSNLVEDS